VAISIPISASSACGFILEDDVLLGELAAIPRNHHNLPFSFIELPLILFALDDLLDDGRLGQFSREVLDV
jgi:hypothetical protein